MPRLYYLGCSFLWVFLFLPRTNCLAAKNEFGKIKFESVSQDFGRVNRGTVINHVFKFENVGKGPLSIQGVFSPCGCTVTDYDQAKVYQPQERGELTVIFDTSQFSGATVKAITVTTNNQLDLDQNLTLNAFVVSEFDLIPPIMDFGKIKATDTISREFEIQLVDQFPMKVTGIEYDPKGLRVDWDPKTLKGVVHINKGLPAGVLQESIVIYNNSQSLPQAKLLVRADIVGAIAATPDYLEFGAIDKNKTSVRQVLLVSDNPFEVKSDTLELRLNGVKVSQPEKYLHIQTNGVSENQKRLDISLENLSAHTGSIHGKVSLLTSDQQQKNISIKFYAFFQ